MKNPIFLSALTFILLFFSFFLSAGQQGIFRGRTEDKNGVKIVKNPSRPVYGRITLDLEKDLTLGSESEENYIFYRVWDIQADARGNIFVLDSGAHRIQKYDRNGKYLRSIGRQGQGPGEFERPIMLAMDSHNNLYVGEMAKIHEFDPNGEFVMAANIPFFYMNFAPDDRGNFIVTGRVTKEGGQNLGVLILNPEGEILKKITEFPGLPLHESGTTISHDYSPQVRFSTIAGKGIVYGYNLAYRLYIADFSGRNVLIIEKEKAPQAISRQEKNKIINELHKNLSRAELGWSKNLIAKMANLPKHRPFFDRIMVDDEGRIYVRRRKSVLDDSLGMAFDIFGSDGHYLYETELSFLPMCIRAGHMYHTVYSEETGEVKVIRYRIKNWDRMYSSLD